MRGELPQQRCSDPLPPGFGQHPRREEASIRRVRRPRVPAADELAVVLGDDVEPTRIALAPLALLLDGRRLVGRDRVPELDVRVEILLRLGGPDRRHEKRLRGQTRSQSRQPLLFSLPWRFA